MIRITVLGSGTSQGIPVVACDCPVCMSDNPKDNRLRSSVLVEYDDCSVSIDVGPDFRQQMLRIGQKSIDAIVVTHEHMDHIAGLDEIRAFNFRSGSNMKVYASQSVIIRLKEQYSYIFKASKYPGVPRVELIEISNSPFEIGGKLWHPIKVKHAGMDVLGFRIDDFCYVTDANYIAQAEKKKIEGSDVLILNALRDQEHHSHYSKAEAIQLGEELKVKQLFLTHISHQMGLHDEVNKNLPAKVQLAYDGQIIKLS